MMPAMTSMPVVVRDHDHARGEGVFLFVEADQRLAAFRAMHAQVAAHLVGVEDVQRAVAGRR